MLVGIIHIEDPEVGSPHDVPKSQRLRVQKPPIRGRGAILNNTRDPVGESFSLLFGVEDVPNISGLAETDGLAHIN